MPQRCTVCDHKDRYDIDLALASGRVSNRSIALQFGLVHTSVRRHKADHLPQVLAEAFKAHKEARAGEIRAEVSQIINRIKKLLAAADDYLSDPDDPTRYTIGPRAEDITVTYTEAVSDGEKRQRRKAPLTSLIARVEHATGIDVVAWESRHSDPRDVLVKASVAARGLFELLAKVEGKLNEQPVVNVIVSPEWAALRAELMRALAPFPDARASVADALSALEGNAGGRIHSC